MALAPLGSGGDADGGYRPMAEINVTPFVDVMLVLLVVFMIAAPLMMVGVPVQLPKTTAAKVAQPREPIIVSIDREGRIFLREEELAPEAVMERLAALAAESPDAVIYVRGDRSISYGQVMQVMGRVSSAGFAKVSLIAHGESAPSAGR